MKNTSSTATFPPAPIKPGDLVTFPDLPEPLMTVVDIDKKKGVVLCKYNDDCAGEVRLECSVDGVVPAPPQHQQPNA